MTLASLLPGCTGVAAVVEPTPGQSSGNLAKSGSYVEIIDNTTHNAFPGICISDTDELMVSYRKGADHNVDSSAYIVGRWSDDGGASWSGETTLYDPDGADPRDSTLAKLSDGRVALCCFHNNGTVASSKVLFSSDNGRTFGSPITPSPVSPVATSHSTTAPIVEGVNGDLLLVMSGYDDAADLRSNVILRSDDDGATWGSQVTMAYGPDTEDDGLGAESEGSFFEPFLLRLDGNNLLCAHRHSQEKFWITTSTDDGATWSTPETSGLVGYGRPSLGRVDATGAVVISTRTNTDIFYRTSWDNGDSWAAAVTVDTGFRMAYAQMVETSPGILAHVWAMEDPNAGYGAIRFNYLYDTSLEDPLP